MEPEIISIDAMMIAGVSGTGDETGLAWQSYMKLEKAVPLTNALDGRGYEIRLYPNGTGPGRVHVGMQVQDRNVPREYTVLPVPASLYATFEIYPARGYESSNELIEKWLYDNSDTYRQRMLDGNSYGIEIYDERFKGDTDPESVVGVLVPIEPVDGFNGD